MLISNFFERSLLDFCFCLISFSLSFSPCLSHAKGWRCLLIGNTTVCRPVLGVTHHRAKKPVLCLMSAAEALLWRLQRAFHHHGDYGGVCEH